MIDIQISNEDNGNIFVRCSRINDQSDIIGGKIFKIGKPISAIA
jgi:hypothetical protein